MCRDVKEMEPFIRGFSSRAFRRARAAGAASMAYEDILQESYVGWVIANNTFDEDSNVPFFAYARRGIMQHVNRFIEKNVERCSDEVWALSLDKSHSEDDPEGSTLAEVIPSNELSAEKIVLMKDSYNRAISKLSPMARKFVELLQEQPVELLGEIRHLSARCEFGRGRGIPVTHQNRLTSVMIFDLLGASRSERNRIAREIKSLGQRMTKIA